MRNRSDTEVDPPGRVGTVEIPPLPRKPPPKYPPPLMRQPPLLPPPPLPRKPPPLPPNWHPSQPSFCWQDSSVSVLQPHRSLLLLLAACTAIGFLIGLMLL
jgi:hypothetical protein